MRTKIKYNTYENIFSDITTVRRQAEIRMTASKKEIYGRLEDVVEEMIKEVQGAGYKIHLKSKDDRRQECKLIIEIKNRNDYENIKETYDTVKRLI